MGDTSLALYSIVSNAHARAESGPKPLLAEDSVSAVESADSPDFP
jgi:hypothetical protein